jgi:hypothetical protein
VEVVRQSDLLQIEDFGDDEIGITIRADDQPIAAQPWERVKVLSRRHESGYTVYACETLDPDDTEYLTVQVHGVPSGRRIGVVTWKA